MQVATKHASVKMFTSKPGNYKYTFNRMSDGHYNLEAMDRYFEPIVVEQTVHTRPKIGFVNKGRMYKACANADIEDSAIEPIPIAFTGQGPYSLTLSVLHESTGLVDRVQISNIEGKVYNLRKVYERLGLGRHVVSIFQVTDSNGCVRDGFSESEKVYIVISDVAHLTPLSTKEHYCVGERIGFALVGTAPFEVVYEFNGKKQRASTPSPFSRLASAPGNLTLLSLSDSGSNCVTKLDEKPIEIHPMPSIHVTEGISVVKDIHEGDQAELIFSLSGTPPFSFTYTRSELVGRPPRPKIIETHSVSNVEGYQYSIFTNLQGTYEVISIQDRYCSVSST